MRTTRRRAGWVLAGSWATVGCSLAACSGGNEVADVSVVPPAATAAATSSEDPGTTADANPTTTTDADTATSEAPDTTTGTSTTDDRDGPDGDSGGEPGGPTFSDALGERVDTAPGVSTPGDTRRLLPEGLYVHIAWTADPNDPSVFTVQPDDVEILEAYANAVTTYYRSAMASRTTGDPDFNRYITDAEAMFGRAFDQAREGGYVMNLGAGVVLRPYVVDRDSSSATVYDCYLQDEQYIEEGTEREPGLLSPKGQVTTVLALGGRWIVDSAGPLGSACL